MNALIGKALEFVPRQFVSRLQTNARTRLLRQSDALLMVHNNRLYDVSNESWVSLSFEDDETPAQRLANAAKHLLSSRQEAPSVLLLLPSPHFMATEVALPGLYGESVRSALRLQSEVLFPSYQATLSYAVNVTATPADSRHCVIWTDSSALEALYEACQANGIFLAGVMPRILVATTQVDASETFTVTEDDDRTLTHVRIARGVVTQFLQIAKSDLNDEEFARQWRDACTTQTTDGQIALSISSPEEYRSLTPKESIAAHYVFVPEGAQQAARRAQKGFRVLLTSAAVLALLVFGSLPFMWQSFQMMRLESQIEQLQAQSVQAREDQSQVREFELDWGVLTEFPQQSISEVLLQMQNVLSPSVLTSVEIDEGAIQIEGESEDPQSLLRLLEQNAMFAGADFARATNNNRYYIAFRLSTVDFDAYHGWHFPDERR